MRTLVAVETGIDRAPLQQSLPLHSDIEIVGVVEGFDESWRTLEETPTDLLVVVCQHYSDRALFLIDSAVKERPDRPVVVLCYGSPNGFIKRVFEAGADDFLPLPESPERVKFALQKALARKQGLAIATGTAAAPMLVVLGPKGGTGKTLTACNVAVALAQEGKRVAIVDLDLQFGDVGLALGLTPDQTIYDLAKAGGSIDAGKVDAFLTKHSSGVSALLAPTRPDHAGLVTTEFLREVYAALRASHEFVVVDTAPGFTPEVIASIDSATEACMVAMLDALSLKNTKLGLETLDLMGFDPARVQLVLNRSDTRVGIAYEDVIAILGRPPDVAIPSDRSIPTAINSGTPIVLVDERSEATKAFKAIAATYSAGLPRAHLNGGNGAKPDRTNLIARIAGR